MGVLVAERGGRELDKVLSTYKVNKARVDAILIPQLTARALPFFMGSKIAGVAPFPGLDLSDGA